MTPATEIKKALNADPRLDKDIAVLAGITPTSLARFKCGIRNLAPETLIRLAKVLGYRLETRFVKSGKNS